MKAVASALVAFGLSFVALTLIEKLIHKLTKNPDTSYRWGVWTFSILIAGWTYFASLGR